MPLAAVFGGGNAMAAYCAGAAAALSLAGHAPDHVAGASGGAIIAAIFAGNPPARRAAALRDFWSRIAQPQQPGPPLPAGWQRLLELGHGLEARLFGRPGMFSLNLSSLFNRQETPSLYDLAPLRETLGACLDLDRLNGEMQVSILAVDLATGAETVFSNRDMRLTLDHILASSALPPDFQPVEIGGQLFVDGGLAANAPVHLVLEHPEDQLACFVVDPFPLGAAPPRSLLDAQERQSDLIYALQTQRSLLACARIWRQHGARGAVWRIEHRDGAPETALKGFSFAAAALRRRSERGERDMRAALRAWGGAAPATPGLCLHFMPPAPCPPEDRET